MPVGEAGEKRVGWGGKKRKGGRCRCLCVLGGEERSEEIREVEKKGAGGMEVWV